MFRLALTVPRTALRHPGLGLIWVGTLAWLALRAELPSLGPSGETPQDLAAALLLASWLGTVVAMGLLPQEAWLLRHLTPAARVWTEVAAVGCTAILAFLPLAVAAAFESDPGDVALQSFRLLPLLVKGSAAAALLLRVPLAAPYCTWAYILATWLLPALPLGVPPLELLLERLLGWPVPPEAQLRGEMLGPPPILADMAGAAALGLGSWMILKTRGGQRCATGS